VQKPRAPDVGRRQIAGRPTVLPPILDPESTAADPLAPSRSYRRPARVHRRKVQEKGLPLFPQQLIHMEIEVAPLGSHQPQVGARARRHRRCERLAKGPPGPHHPCEGGQPPESNEPQPRARDAGAVEPTGKVRAAPRRYQRMMSSEAGRQAEATWAPSPQQREPA